MSCRISASIGFPDRKPATNAPATNIPNVASDGTAAFPPASAGPNAAPRDRMPLPSLAEVLRFDVTVEWVLQRWPRVTTGLPQLQLQGYRVPLVSGTQISDVAGSLTYYFNARQQVQRITLRGTTGDPSALVNLLASRYHFARRLTNDPGIILYEAVDPEQSADRYAEDPLGAGGECQPALLAVPDSIW